MLFQQEMRLPIDNEVMPKEEGGERLDVGFEDDEDCDFEELLEKRSELFETVGSNILMAQQKQKETYDRKHLQEELNPGTEVLIENSAQKGRKGGKLDDAFDGPYSIHECIGKGIYKIKNKKGVVLQKKVNISRLKVYKRRGSFNLVTLDHDDGDDEQTIKVSNDAKLCFQ